MGDLISTSAALEADGKEAGAETDGTATVEGAGAEEPSSYCRAGPPLGPRLSLILKSCRSSSNSEMEFFFIRSIMALMSFKSTDGSRFGFPPARSESRSISHPAHEQPTVQPFSCWS